MPTPVKTANPLTFLDLVSRNVGLKPDINISAGDFISANYQHSQNLHTQYVNNKTTAKTYVNNKTTTKHTYRAHLSVKMSDKHKFAAYIDDNCLRWISSFILSYVSDTGKKCLEYFLCQVSWKATARTALKVLFHHGKLTFFSLS